MRSALQRRRHLSVIRYMIGRDMHRRWIVCDRWGSNDYVFTNRRAALHFALFEHDEEPDAVVCLPDHVCVLPRLRDA